jgi:membrane-bound lytic murein transglycosylase D
MSRFGAGAAAALGALALGCGHPGAQAPAPELNAAGDTIPSPSWQQSPEGVESAKPAVAGVPDDSAADRAALDALAALDFAGQGGPDTASRWRDEASVSAGEIAHETARLFADDAGGATSGSGTAASLDLFSFATHSRVRYYVDYFLGPARDRFAIWLGRLPRYERVIREQLARHGVPEELVYLAMIESGYSNTATSRARAAGMWQFVARTGREYGLHQDVWVDERRDPFRATEAAARHLADLNAAFGSWYLAAAAYNAGAGRVTRGLRRLPWGGEDASDSTFFELYDRRYLRLETRDYVPKLIAAALIAQDPARYGFDSVPRLEPLAFDEVYIADATGLDVLARLSDTTTRALVELNPQLVRGVTPPGRAVIVRVPAGTGSVVARRWGALPANERVTFLHHRVAAGETLSWIAQRYRVGLEVLRAANPGVRPTRLRIGQTLTVPLSPTARLAVAGRGKRAPAAALAGYYTVRAGDSLWTIAQRHGVRVADLKTWNGLDSSLVRPGQHLRVAAP